jgi:hypothetical protein
MIEANSNGQVFQLAVGPGARGSRRYLRARMETFAA